MILRNSNVAFRAKSWRFVNNIRNHFAVYAHISHVKNIDHAFPIDGELLCVFLN